MNQTPLAPRDRPISKEQVRARYQAGTMGEKTCVLYLQAAYGLTELQALEVLCPHDGLG